VNRFQSGKRTRVDGLKAMRTSELCQLQGLILVYQRSLLLLTSRMRGLLAPIRFSVTNHRWLWTRARASVNISESQSKVMLKPSYAERRGQAIPEAAASYS